MARLAVLEAELCFDASEDMCILQALAVVHVIGNKLFPLSLATGLPNAALSVARGGRCDGFIAMLCSIALASICCHICWHLFLHSASVVHRLPGLCCALGFA